jgi:hypothetical protein
MSFKIFTSKQSYDDFKLSYLISDKRIIIFLNKKVIIDFYDFKDDIELYEVEQKVFLIINYLMKYFWKI